MPRGRKTEVLSSVPPSIAFATGAVITEVPEASASQALDAVAAAQAAQPADLPAADAQYQLARHYANAAAFGAARPKELYERANRLYGASLQIYEARHGASHERTRFAREGLRTVQQVTGRPSRHSSSPAAT